MLQPFSTFDAVQNYLYELSKESKSLKFSINEDFIAKQSKLMTLLGNPELKLKVIHIAGTSGKGSTATILTSILISQKFKVGSSVSPHIIDICERIQINGSPIYKDKFLSYFNQILPALNQLINEDLPPSYFETLTALQLFIFEKEKVDYAIIEVGIGGRLDATNVFIPNKLCIINSIGLDHTEILGDTLVKIAGEKAGIIQEKNQVIALSQSREVNQVFIDKSHDMQADLDFVIPVFCFQNVTLYNNKTYFDYIDQDILDRQICLGMLGKYQAANASLALRAVETLSDRDNWTIDWDRLKHQLQFTKLIGRFEVIESQGKITILDGAHNPQKMNSFLASLVENYPVQKFDCLLAFKKGKDSFKMLDELLIYRDKINSIVLTRFGGVQDFIIESQDTNEASEYLTQNKFTNYIVEENLDKAYTLIQKNVETISVVTGSLYLISAIKNL